MAAIFVFRLNVSIQSVFSEILIQGPHMVLISYKVLKKESPWLIDAEWRIYVVSVN